MITVIRDRSGNIKTFSASPLESYNVALDETSEVLDISMVDYAGRFKLSIPPFEGGYAALHVIEFDAEVLLQTNLKVDTIDVDINGVVESVPIKDGLGKIILDLSTPGRFIIQPADRRQYCAAGNGYLIVEVLPNE
jgi:hypothetical protein